MVWKDGSRWWKNLIYKGLWEVRVKFGGIFFEFGGWKNSLIIKIIIFSLLNLMLWNG